MSGLPIDRMAQRRGDEDWLSREFANPRSRVLVLSEGRVLVRGSGRDAQLADLPPALRTESQMGGHQHGSTIAETGLDAGLKAITRHCSAGLIRPPGLPPAFRGRLPRPWPISRTPA